MGHVTRLQLFHKVHYDHNYDNYPAEFSTPPGNNHLRAHQFPLEPPVRARYLLLGVAEYDRHPCLRFDFQVSSLSLYLFVCSPWIEIL
jgi:hypothetical protein